jgi:hypothetical protein
MVILVQKEVGERLVANPGSDSYGSLSVFVQSGARVEWICAVPRSVLSCTQSRFCGDINNTEFGVAVVDRFPRDARAYVSSDFWAKKKNIAECFVEISSLEANTRRAWYGFQRIGLFASASGGSSPPRPNS